MAKKEKTPKVEAPIVNKPATNQKDGKVSVVQMGDLEKLGQSYTKNGGLDANRRIDLLTGLRIMFHDDPTVAKNLGITEDAVNKINGITALGFAAALIDEVQYGPSGWAAKMRVSQLEQIKSVMPLLGVELDTKALPAPDKDGNVEVPKTAIKVSKEAKKKLEAERKANKDAEVKEYMTDHTQIETDEQLHEALGFQLSNSKINSPVDRLVTAAQFYRSYLEARAEKSDNPEAELTKIHEFTIVNLLQDIITMVPPTFVASGFGKILCISAETANSIVPAFNMFKRASYNKKAKKYNYTDEEIAAFTRVLMVWYATSRIAELGESITRCNNGIAELNKNAEANAKAIESETKKIEGYNNAIAHFQGLITLASEPNFDLVDSLTECYNDAANPSHDSAERIVKSVIETYYKDGKIPELQMPSVVLNAKQYAGMTLNLFRDPLTRRTDFSPENLIAIEYEKVEEATEGEGKNS
jgi:hypothetical protein